MTAQGCIDLVTNPFANADWIAQNRRFTSHRAEQLERILGRQVKAIQAEPDNENSYPAFVGVHWGFARIEAGVLVATDKWHQRHAYDAWGQPRSSGSQPRQRHPKPQSTPRREAAVAGAVQHPPTLDAPAIEAVRIELDRRRQILIAAAENPSIQMESVERDHILAYLRDGRLPSRPTTIHALLRELVSSALSINQPPFRTRNRLTRVLGKIPVGDTIGQCLAQLLQAESLRRDATWEPAALVATLDDLRVSQPTSDAFMAYVLTTSMDCAKTLEQWVAHGLDAFYARVEAGLASGPEAAWTFLQALSKPIRGVGPVLMADFLKNSGFHRLVKLDQRLQREFPDLLGNATRDPRRLFIAAWHLADQLGMEPFVLDHLLYQWGDQGLAPAG